MGNSYRLSKEDDTTYCLICQESIKTDFLYDHIQMHSGVNPAACKNCLKEFNSSEDVKKALSWLYYRNEHNIMVFYAAMLKTFRRIWCCISAIFIAVVWTDHERSERQKRMMHGHVCKTTNTEKKMWNLQILSQSWLWSGQILLGQKQIWWSSFAEKTLHGKKVW